MVTELYWHGQRTVEVFHDTKRNREYWPSEQPYEVPDEAVEWYLSFAGWERELRNEGVKDDSESTAGGAWHAFMQRGEGLFGSADVED